MSGAIDFDGINAAALRSARSFLSGLIPGGKFRSLEYLVRNPRRDDREPGSFSINYKTGKWGDFATKDRGGDLISLVAHLRNCSQGEAARWLADKLGVPAFKSNGVVSRPNGVNGHSNGAALLASPKVISSGDDEPPRQSDEIRRHSYHNGDGVAVRIKIKYADDRYAQWYRADGCWQNKKPDDYQPVPYITAALAPSIQS